MRLQSLEEILGQRSEGDACNKTRTVVMKLMQTEKQNKTLCKALDGKLGATASLLLLVGTFPIRAFFLSVHMGGNRSEVAVAIWMLDMFLSIAWCGKELLLQCHKNKMGREGCLLENE